MQATVLSLGRRAVRRGDDEDEDDHEDVDVESDRDICTAWNPDTSERNEIKTEFRTFYPFLQYIVFDGVRINDEEPEPEPQPEGQQFAEPQDELVSEPTLEDRTSVSLTPTQKSIIALMSAMKEHGVVAKTILRPSS